MTEQPQILVLTGVTGSGKSAIAGILSLSLRWDVVDAEELHPQESLAKMAAGHSLDDGDRSAWLLAVADWVHARQAGERPVILTGAVLTRAHRAMLATPTTRFVLLEGTRDEIARRIADRHGQYIASTLLDAQLARLEPLGADEEGITIDAGNGAAHCAAEIIRRMGLPTTGRDHSGGGVRQPA